MTSPTYPSTAERDRERVPLAGSGLVVSRLALGTAALAGMFQPVSEVQAIATVEAAMDAGITYFDTAPQYGAGLAETRLGRALRGISPSSVVISTKVGRVIEHSATPVDSPWVNADPRLHDVFDFSAVGVLRSLQDSLARIGRDAVDIVYIHDPENHIEQAVGEAYPALAELRARGIVRAIGVGTNRAETAVRFVVDTDIDVALIAGRHTLLDADADAVLLPAAMEKHTAIVVGGVFNSGVLADPGVGVTFDYQPAPAAIIERAQRLAAIAAEAGVPLAAAALQFPARHNSVTAVLMGCRSVAEVHSNIADFDCEIPPSTWAQLLAERARNLS
jgi:D-threo-aldose 1-dehydrogenase